MIDEALHHSNKCQQLLSDGLAADALAYCVAQGVQPPPYGSNQHRVGGEGLHDLATQMLADYGWWVKKLKLRAARESEMRRIRQGLSALGKQGNLSHSE